MADSSFARPDKPTAAPYRKLSLKDRRQLAEAERLRQRAAEKDQEDGTLVNTPEDYAQSVAGFVWRALDGAGRMYGLVESNADKGFNWPLAGYRHSRDVAEQYRVLAEQLYFLLSNPETVCYSELKRPTRRQAKELRLKAAQHDGPLQRLLQEAAVSAPTLVEPDEASR